MLRVLDLKSPGVKSFSYPSCDSLFHQSTGSHIVEAVLISHVKDVLFCINSSIKLEKDNLSPVNKALLQKMNIYTYQKVSCRKLI